MQKTVEPLGFVETINHPIVPPKGEATLTVSVESSSKIYQLSVLFLTSVFLAETGCKNFFVGNQIFNKDAK